MGSNTSNFDIPTINIAPYLKDPSSEAAEQIVQDVRSACMTAGFFSLVGHKIQRKTQNDVFEAAKRLFSLPVEEKRALRHPVLKNRGYELIGAQALQDGTLPDLKEVYKPTQLIGRQLCLTYLRVSILANTYRPSLPKSRHIHTFWERISSPRAFQPQSFKNRLRRTTRPFLTYPSKFWIFLPEVCPMGMESFVNLLPMIPSVP